MCQVLGRQRHMSVSSAAIRGRNACCLFPGSWADTGGSQSAVFEKAELECPTTPAPSRPQASQPACLSVWREVLTCKSTSSFHMQPPPFLSYTLKLEEKSSCGKKTAFNGKLLLEPYKWVVELKSWVVKKQKQKKKTTCVFQSSCSFHVCSKCGSAVQYDHMSVATRHPAVTVYSQDCKEASDRANTNQMFPLKFHFSPCFPKVAATDCLWSLLAK